MIDRQGGKLIFECDSCDATEEFGDDENFSECWSRLKRDGWRTRKIGDEWVHGCPSCGV